MTTVTFNPGADCGIFSGTPNTNLGTSTSFGVGWTAVGTRYYRAMIRFDLSSIDFEDVVIASSSTLALYCEGVINGSTTDFEISVGRTTQSWVENQATWNIYATGNNWTSAGGDFTTYNTPITLNGPASAPGLVSITGKPLALAIQDAVDNRNGILDIFLKRTDEASDAATLVFASRENGTVANRPLLTVNYTRRSAGRSEAQSALNPGSVASEGAPE